MITYLSRMAEPGFVLISTLVAAQPAQAAPPVLDAYVDNVTESPDGGSLANATTLSLVGVGSLARWKLTADVAYVAKRGGMPLVTEQRRSGQLALENNRHGINEFYGLTDARISAERSVKLIGNLQLDLLARLTVPTGERGTDRARGRYETMLDAGLRTRMGPAEIWTGAARRFRTDGFYLPGRDINEVYAGASVDVGNRTTLRSDYLRAQSPFNGSALEQSISGAVTHTHNSGISLDIYGSRYSDYFGKSGQVGLTLRMPTKIL